MLKHKDVHFKIVSNRDVQTKSLVTKEVEICQRIVSGETCCVVESWSSKNPSFFIGHISTLHWWRPHLKACEPTVRTKAHHFPQHTPQPSRLALASPNPPRWITFFRGMVISRVSLFKLYNSSTKIKSILGMGFSIHTTTRFSVLGDRMRSDQYEKNHYGIFAIYMNAKGYGFISLQNLHSLIHIWLLNNN